MMKVFIGMTEIAGYYHNLAIGLKENEVETSEFYLSDHIFQYNSQLESLPWIFRIYRRFKAKREINNSNKLSKSFYFFLGSIVSYTFLAWAILKYDVFVFGFGTSILNKNKDLKILRKFNKTVVSVVIHGSESRPPYINGAKRMPTGDFLPAGALIKMAQHMKNQMKVIEQNSDYVLAAPFTSQFLEKEFINHFHIGLPFKIKKEPLNMENSKDNLPVRILHSPSKPLAKGTYEIRKAIQSLKNQGYDVDFVEVINQPNAVVIEELQRCDFIIDQLYSDTPLAGFATEAAFYGKPAIVGGYGWELLKTLLPTEIFPPSEICHPDKLEDAIVKLIEDKDYRISLGKQAMKYVNQNWEAKIVAAKFIKIFTRQIDPAWLIDPNDVKYVSGVGISETDAKNLIGQVIHQGGVDALSVNGNRSLQTALTEFANEDQKVLVPQNSH